MVPSTTTVIRRSEDGGLVAVPYSVAYREWLEPAAVVERILTAREEGA